MRRVGYGYDSSATTTSASLFRLARLPGVGFFVCACNSFCRDGPALGTLDFMTEENRFRVAITASLKLVERGEQSEALKLLDEAIAEAKREQNVSWIRMLCHHAAIVSRFTENLTSAQHYYEESLASDPENARALYGLATVALDQGHLEIALQYAKRSYTANLRREDDEVLKQSLLDLLLKHWPDLAEKPG